MCGCVGWLNSKERLLTGKAPRRLPVSSPAPPWMAGAGTPASGALVRVCLPPLFLLFLCGCGAVEGVEMERTLAMIKPDGLSGKYTEKIKKAILDSGFHIVKEAEVQLDAKKASFFYAEHSQRSFFDSLVKYITSIRAMCGLDSEKNCVHGSDSLESAAREISFFFGEADSVTVEHDEL